MRKPIAALVAGVVVFTAGTALGVSLAGDPQGTADRPRPGNGGMVLAAALQPFDDCEALTAHYRDLALELVGPYGLPGTGGVAVMEGDVAMSADAETAAGAPAGAPAVGPGATGTNVQEVGVDEPDIVKTNGELILVVANNRLQVVAPGPSPNVEGVLALPTGWQHELLINGDRALVLTRGDGGVVPLSGREIAPAGSSMASVLTAVDLSDPSEPRVEATLTLDGDYRSARVVDGIARIVVASQPTALPFTTPDTGGLRAEREALERNREVVQKAEASDWLPWSILADGDGRVVREGPLLECADVSRPQGFTGLGTLSVLTVDLSAGLETRSGVGIVAQGETVYASPDRLFVATTDWRGPDAFLPERPVAEPEVSTSIHAFDISDPVRADYLASGEVSGTLLNSYAMSAENGYLRVATTTQPTWWTGSEAPASESSLIVLEQQGESLAEVGRLDGLGPTETIRGVRFLGDLAAVVTFRQTDPLHLVDLSQPTTPALLGELKIPGYSAYLHPIGDNRLLGIGQAGNEQGELLGVQASLFDLSDRSTPAQVDTLELNAYYAEAENDPRAFLYWPDTALAVVPVQGDKGGGSAMGIRIAGDTLEPVSLPALDGGAPVRRAMVVGELLYVISDAGIQASDLATLAPGGSVRFR